MSQCSNIYLSSNLFIFHAILFIVCRSIGDEYFNAELHSVHMIESKTTVAATVWGSMISVGAENPVFENYLRGWEKVAA